MEWRDPDGPQPDGLSQSLDEAKVARSFRTAAATARRIEEYRRANHVWLREAAELAAALGDTSRGVASGSADLRQRELP
jgi:hypothetical protein